MRLEHLKKVEPPALRTDEGVTVQKDSALPLEAPRVLPLPKKGLRTTKNRELAVRIEEPKLPRLQEALRSESIAPMKPADAYEPPEAILKALESAKKVLVIGHVPPDGDCVGAAIGLARTLEALGKTAHACVDDELPGNVKRLDPEKKVRRASELDDDYDLVVMVDVAATDRLGAAAEAIKKAKRVVIIDHHQDRASHESLGISKEVPLKAWYGEEDEPKKRGQNRRAANSATLLVAATAQRLSERSEKKISAEQWKQIALPLALGVYTDTSGFTREATRMKSMRVFKHLVEKHLGGSDWPVREVLRFDLPKEAKRLLAAIDATYSKTLGHAYIRASKETIAEAKRLAPDASTNDIRGFLLNHLDNCVRYYGVGVMLWETEDQVLVSTRSKTEGPALELAQHIATKLGGTGNGHPHMAGANPPCTLDQVKGVVDSWLAEHPSK